MRIIFEMLGVCDSMSGGAASVFSNLAAPIARHAGADEFVAILTDGPEVILSLDSEGNRAFDSCRIKVIGLPSVIEATRGMSFSMMSRATIAHALSRMNPDVVHVAFPFAENILRPVPAETGAWVTTATCDDVFFDTLPAGRIREALSRYDFIFISSEKSKLRAVDELALEACRLIVTGGSETAAITAKEVWACAVENAKRRPVEVPVVKPRMAFVSPMPPEKTGIAEYSLELLDELKHFYWIDVYTTAPVGADPKIGGYMIHRAADFPFRASSYDRIVYQVGNSPFHAGVLDWIRVWPGTVVLHDFFLSSLVNYRQGSGRENYFFRKLLESHGIEALHGVLGSDHATALSLYPVCGDVFDNAEGVIVHSAYALRLLLKYFPEGVAAPVERMRLLRKPKPLESVDRTAVRAGLGIPPGVMLVGSCGHITDEKCPEVIIAAFAGLVRRESASRELMLVFIGQPGGVEFTEKLNALIAGSGVAHLIRVTGFVTAGAYDEWLFACDIAVQLRRNSRGETSGAVLDCFSAGLPVVINRYASFLEYDESVVAFVDEVPESEGLCAVLGKMISDRSYREGLSSRAFELLRTCHSPSVIVTNFREAVERFHARGFGRNPVRFLKGFPLSAKSAVFLGNLAAQAPILRRSRFYFDVTQFKSKWNCGYMTGIQRVVHGILSGLRAGGIEVWPVEFTDEEDDFRVVAFDVNSRLVSTGIRVGLRYGDRLMLPESRPDITADHPCWEMLHRAGVKVHTIIHDLLPVRIPESFPHGTDAKLLDSLDAVARHADFIHTFSHTVAEDMRTWIAESGTSSKASIGTIRMGSDISTKDMISRPPADPVFDGAAPVFALVATIETGKGHAFALDAFERLWRDDSEARLCFVGRIGRGVDDFVSRMLAHPELDRRLFFLDGVSDEVLSYVYRHATGFIVPSLGEGFGMSPVEASRHGLPIFASDIPIFHEVCGDNATYFSLSDCYALVAVLKEFLSTGLPSERRPDFIPVHTWDNCVEDILASVEPTSHAALTAPFRTRI